jgi:uncharacterized protein YcfJ
MKKVLLIICLTFGIAQADSFRQHNKNTGYQPKRTTVITKTVYVNQNRRHDNRIQRTQYVNHVTYNNQSNRAFGAILGGVVGGIIGHQIGGGSGNVVATVGGGVVGTVVGSNLARGHAQERVVYYNNTPRHQYQRVTYVNHNRFQRRNYR